LLSRKGLDEREGLKLTEAEAQASETTNRNSGRRGVPRYSGTIHRRKRGRDTSRERVLHPNLSMRRRKGSLKSSMEGTIPKIKLEFARDRDWLFMPEKRKRKRSDEKWKRRGEDLIEWIPSEGKGGREYQSFLVCCARALK